MVNWTCPELRKNEANWPKSVKCQVFKFKAAEASIESSDFKLNTPNFRQHVGLRRREQVSPKMVASQGIGGTILSSNVHP